MTATEFLEGDHRAVRRLFARYRRTFRSGPAAKGALFSLIRRRLRLHLKLEEELFYPALQEAAAAGDGAPVEAALDAHFALERLLADLAAMHPARRGYDAKIEELRRRLDRHMREEERGLFGEARRRLSRDRLERLGAALAARRDAAEA